MRKEIAQEREAEGGEVAYIYKERERKEEVKGGV